MPWHTLLPKRTRIGTRIWLVTTRYESEFPTSGSDIVHIDLHLNMERIALWDIRVPSGITYGPRGYSPHLWCQYNQVVVSEIHQRPVVTWIIDNIDENRVFFKRIWDVVKGCGGFTPLNPIQPFVLTFRCPIIESGLKPVEIFPLNRVFKNEIAFFFPLFFLFGCR